MGLGFKYDPEADVAYLRFSTDKVVESEEVSPGVVLDYDSAGRIVALEFTQARGRLPIDVLAE